MIEVLRQRNFALLWWGGLISMSGDWMLRIALPIYVYQLTGSTLATGAMFMAGQLPTLLFGSLAGVFVDRWDRKRTMVIANLLLMVGVLPLVLVRSAEWVWVVYVVAFWQSCVSQFFGPAENALLPMLVEERKLVTANTLNALNNNLARLVGPTIGGVVALSLGLYGVAVLDALTFAAAAGLIALISLPERPVVVANTSTDAEWRKVWQEWREGISLVWQIPRLRVLFSMIALWALGEGVMSVLFVPFVTTVLKGGSLELGWLMSAQAVGGLVGGVVMAKIGERVPPAKLLGPATLIFGIIDLMIFNYPLFFPGYLIAIVLFMLVGIPGAGSFASMMTLLQTSVRDEYRGRLFGAYTTIFGVVTLIGMGFASTMGDVLGVIPVINIQGIVFVLAGLVAMIFLSERGMRLTNTPETV